MDKKTAIELYQRGLLKDAQIIQKSGQWEIWLIARYDAPAVITARNGKSAARVTRKFASLDAAAKYVRGVGFNAATVVFDTVAE